MKKYKYLIVGGGMTAASAVEGIREVDRNGSVALFSKESTPPYKRPPLSKSLWKQGKVEDIWRDIDYRSVDLYLDCSIDHLHPAEKLVQDQTGNQFQYEKCLLATGGYPRKLPFGNDQIIYYRTFADYQKLKQKVKEGSRFAVIGGGFIGAEIAAALCMNGQPVTMIFPETGVNANLFPADLTDFITEVYRHKGIKVFNGRLVEDLSRDKDRKIILHLDDGTRLEEGQIVAGLGIAPATQLASDAGLAIENGIMVDDYLQTSAPDIFAAGDVAAFLAPGLNVRIRVEHEDNANTMGRIAGINMAGGEQPYHYLPMFYSDLFEYGYEAVGILDSQLKTYSNWQKPYERGVVLYLDEDRICGVLLWNVWGKVDAARKLISESKKYPQNKLKDLTDSLLSK